MVAQPIDDDAVFIVSEILESLDNITSFANKGTFTDARLLVLATLAHARATLLVAERLREIHQLKYELKS